MRFKDLCDKAKSGKELIHGKREFTDKDRQEYAKILKSMGWERWHMTEEELLERTARVLEGISKGITDDNVREKVLVSSMRNLRVSNTEHFTDRYKFIIPGELDITVICEMRGTRGNYHIYSKENNFCSAVHHSTSVREVGKYIDSLVA